MNIPINKPRNPVYRIQPPVPQQVIIDSIMEHIKEKNEANRYLAQQKFRESVTPTSLTDPLLNLKVRDYYAQKEEQNIWTESVGRLEGAGIGALIGAGITFGAAGLVEAGGFILAPFTGLSSIVGATAIAETILSTTGAMAAIGAGVGALTSNYETYGATKALLNDTIIGSFKQGVGYGTLKTMSVVGKTTDLIEGGEALRATLASAINGEDISEAILNAYGLNTKEGRTEYDFEKVREAMGIDIGSFGNTIFDLTGDLITDPGVLASAGKSLAGKLVKSDFLDDINNISKKLEKHITDATILKSNKSKILHKEKNNILNQLSKALLDDDIIEFKRLLNIKDANSSRYITRYFNQIRKKGIQSAYYKAYKVFESIDNFDDTFVRWGNRLLNPVFGATAAINKGVPYIATKFPENKFFDKLLGNGRYRSLTEAIINSSKEKKRINKMYQSIDESFKFEDLDEDLITSKEASELGIKNMYEFKKLLYEQPDNIKAKEINDRIKKTYSKQKDNLQKELDGLFKKLENEKPENFKELKEEILSKMSELNSIESKAEYFEKSYIYNRTNHIMTSLKHISDYAKNYDLNNNMSESVQKMFDELLKLEKQNPDEVALALSRRQSSQIISFLKGCISEEFDKELKVWYGETKDVYIKTLEEISPKYRKQFYKEIMNGLSNDIKKQLNNLLNGESKEVIDYTNLKTVNKQDLNKIISALDEIQTTNEDKIKINFSKHIDRLEAKIKDYELKKHNIDVFDNVFTNKDIETSSEIFSHDVFNATDLQMSRQQIKDAILNTLYEEQRLEGMKELLDKDESNIVNNIISELKSFRTQIYSVNSDAGRAYGILKSLKNSFESFKNNINDYYHSFRSYINEPLKNKFKTREEFFDNIVSMILKNPNAKNYEFLNNVKDKFPDLKSLPDSYLKLLLNKVDSLSLLKNRIYGIYNTMKYTEGLAYILRNKYNQGYITKLKDSIVYQFKIGKLTKLDYDRYVKFTDDMSKSINELNDFINIGFSGKKKDIKEILDKMDLFETNLKKSEELQLKLAINGLNININNLNKLKETYNKKNTIISNFLNNVHDPLIKRLNDQTKLSKPLNEKDSLIMENWLNLLVKNKCINTIKSIEYSLEDETLINRADEIYKLFIEKGRLVAKYNDYYIPVHEFLNEVPRKKLRKFYEDLYNKLISNLESNESFISTANNQITNLKKCNDNLTSGIKKLFDPNNKFENLDLFNSDAITYSYLNHIENDIDKIVKDTLKGKLDSSLILNIEKQLKINTDLKDPINKAYLNKLSSFFGLIKNNNLTDENIKEFNKQIDNIKRIRGIDKSLNALGIKLDLNHFNFLTNKYNNSDFSKTFNNFITNIFKKNDPKGMIEFLKDYQSKELWNLIQYNDDNGFTSFLSELNELKNKINLTFFNYKTMTYNNPKLSDDNNKEITNLLKQFFDKYRGINKENTKEFVDKYYKDKKYKWFEDKDISTDEFKKFAKYLGKDLPSNYLQIDLDNLFSKDYTSNLVNQKYNCFVNLGNETMFNKLISLKKCRFIYVDTETTGDPEQNGLLSAAYRIIEFNPETNRFEVVPNGVASFYISEDTFKKTGWKLSDAVKELNKNNKYMFDNNSTYTPDQIREAIHKKIKDYNDDKCNIMVAHNAKFDFDVLNGEDNKFQDISTLDTLTLYRMLNLSDFGFNTKIKEVNGKVRDNTIFKNSNLGAIFDGINYVEYNGSDVDVKGNLINGELNNIRFDKSKEYTLEKHYYKDGTIEYRLRKTIESESRALHDGDVDTELSTLLFNNIMDKLAISENFDTINRYTNMLDFSSIDSFLKRDKNRKIIDIIYNGLDILKSKKLEKLDPNIIEQNHLLETFINDLNHLELGEDKYTIDNLYEIENCIENFINKHEKEDWFDSINITNINEIEKQKWKDVYNTINDLKKLRYAINSKNLKAYPRDLLNYLDLIPNKNDKIIELKEAIKRNYNSTIKSNKYKEITKELDYLIKEFEDKERNINYETIVDLTTIKNNITSLIKEYKEEQFAFNKLLNNQSYFVRQINRNKVNLELISSYTNNESIKILKNILNGNYEVFSEESDNYLLAKTVKNYNLQNLPQIKKLNEMFKKVERGIDFYVDALTNENSILKKKPLLLDKFQQMLDEAEFNYDGDIDKLISRLNNKFIRSYNTVEEFLDLKQVRDLIVDYIRTVPKGSELIIQPTTAFQSQIFTTLEDTLGQAVKELANSKNGSIQFNTEMNSLDNALNGGDKGAGLIYSSLSGLRETLSTTKKENRKLSLEMLPNQLIQNGIENPYADEARKMLKPTELISLNSKHTIKYLDEDYKKGASLKRRCNNIISMYGLFKEYDNSNPDEFYLAKQHETKIGQLFNSLSNIFKITPDDFTKAASNYKVEYTDFMADMENYLFKNYDSFSKVFPNLDYNDYKKINAFLMEINGIRETDMEYINDISKLRNTYKAYLIDGLLNRYDTYSGFDSFKHNEFKISKKANNYYKFRKMYPRFKESSEQFMEFKKMFNSPDEFVNYLKNHKGQRLIFLNTDKGRFDDIVPTIENINYVLNDNEGMFSLMSRDTYYKLTKEFNPNKIEVNKLVKYIDDSGKEIVEDYDTNNFDLMNTLQRIRNTEGRDFEIIDKSGFNTVINKLKETFLIPLKIASLTWSIPFIVQNALTAAMQNMRQYEGPMNIFKFMKDVSTTNKKYQRNKEIEEMLLNNPSFIRFSVGKNSYIKLIQQEDIIEKLIAEDVDTEIIDYIRKLKSTLTEQDFKDIEMIDSLLSSNAVRGEISDLQANLMVGQAKRKDWNKLSTDEKFIYNSKPNKEFNSLEDELKYYRLKDQNKLTSIEHKRVNELNRLINDKKYAVYKVFNIRFAKKFMDMNEDLERVVRLQLILDLMEQGYSKEDSLSKVIDTHFVYDNKTVMEQYAEFIVPFISYPIRAANQLDELMSDYDFYKMMYLWDRDNWKNHNSENSDYLTKRRARGDIPVGDKLLQVGNPLMETMTNITNPLYALNNKLNPVIKPFVDLATGSEYNRWTQFPGISQAKAIYDIGSSSNPLVQFTNDYYKSPRFINYYLPRMSTNYPKFYSSLYTRTGYSRVAMNMSNLNKNNLYYRVNAILNYNGPKK